MNIITEYPIWLSVLCVITGAIYSIILYRKDKRLTDVSMFVRRSMSVLRFLSISLLAFFLLSPLIKHISRRVEKPVIIIAQDNSESILIGKDTAFIKSEYKLQMKQLTEELSDKYDVRLYSFSDQITEQRSFDSILYDEKQTDISMFLNELETRYANKNVGALILASDGIYNKGANPVYTSEKLKYPIYAIALGDTTIKNDLLVAKVDHNRLAYLGNQFPLEINITAQKLSGKSATLTISKSGQTLFSQQININSESFSTTVPVYLDAKETGLQHYRVMLTSLPDEVSTANNFKDIYIEVLDARQKILLLSDAPHPDVAAIKQSLENNQNYEVESYLADNFDKSVNKYNLVILHSLPNNKNSIPKLIKEITENTTPVWIFTGASSFLKNGFSYTTAQKTNDVEPLLDPDFPLFTISDELRTAVKDFPAVSCPFGMSQTAENANVLFFQRIGVVDTKTPLMQFFVQNENKMAIFNGEGIWRWKLQDYAVNNSHQLFDEFVFKTVQYLSVKMDKSFFRIITKNNFLENENIELEAELYNESYELINDPEVSVNVINKENKKYPFVFSKTNNAYRLNAGVFPVGEYKYQAQVKVGSKLHTQSGSFTVAPLQVELTNTTADHQMLYTIAKKHQGQMVYPRNIGSLIDLLNQREDIKSISYSEKKLDDLINLKWIFFLILFLLSLEWFMRKRNGAY